MATKPQKLKLRNSLKANTKISPDDQARKLDIIVTEKKNPSNFGITKIITVLFIVFLLGWLITSLYFSAEEIIRPKDADLQLEKNISADEQANAQSTIPSITDRPEVDDVISGKKNCTIQEASSLIQKNLMSIESVAYIVSYKQDFMGSKFVTTYQNQTCKIYAPTKQQLKAFLATRGYEEIPLKNSTVFVDFGETVRTSQQAYDLTIQPRIAKILASLYDDVEGSTLTLPVNYTRK